MDLQTTSLVKKTRRSVLGDRRSKFNSLLIKFSSSLVGLVGPVMSGIGEPASDPSMISLLNMREPMDLQTTTLVNRVGEVPGRQTFKVQ
jgi:hypothetical protein